MQNEFSVHLLILTTEQPHCILHGGKRGHLFTLGGRHHLNKNLMKLIRSIYHKYSKRYARLHWDSVALFPSCRLYKLPTC